MMHRCFPRSGGLRFCRRRLRRIGRLRILQQVFLWQGFLWQAPSNRMSSQPASSHQKMAEFATRVLVALAPVNYRESVVLWRFQPQNT